MRLKILHLCTFKGTVRPDWICMRVVPLDRRCKIHQSLYVVDFLFHFWIFEKTSKFWAASYKNDSNLLLVHIKVCIESFLPIGWRTFLDEKIRRSAALFWFGLRDVGILQIFYSRAIIQRTIVDSPAFLAEKIAVWIHTNRDPNKQEVGFIFVWSYGTQNFDVFSVIPNEN